MPLKNLIFEKKMLGTIDRKKIVAEVSLAREKTRAPSRQDHRQIKPSGKRVQARGEKIDRFCLCRAFLE